jgi:hypothetical protein
MEENKKPENPKAFPMDFSKDGAIMQSGMTLRDYFANQAMNSIISKSSLSDIVSKKGQSYIGICAYEIADTMLQAREKN